MTTPQSYLAKKAAKKAAKATLRHAAHGTATKARRQPIRSATLLGLGAAIGALGTTLAGRRRAANAEAAREAAEAAQRADQERASERHERRRREADDRTLTDRVKTEVFRPADAPKGDVVVDSENGVVHLRGSVATADIRDRLVATARGVDGVARVEDLLKVRD